jgi:hypothetical protein
MLGRCDQALVTQSTGTRAVVGPHPGFRVSFRLWLVRMRVPLLMITRGTPALTGLRLLLTTVTSLVVVFEYCLFFMVGQLLT